MFICVLSRLVQYPDEFPSKWKWNSKGKFWSVRKKGFTIGRLFYVHPSAGEKFFLRLLLNVVPGAKSYEELRTFDGHLYESFRDARNARGMLGEDSEWEDAVVEAAQWASGNTVRELFAMILMHCEVSDSSLLFSKTWKLLSEGLEAHWRHVLHRPNLNFTDDQLKNHTLLAIEEILVESGRSLQQYGLPRPENSNSFANKNTLLAEELNYDKKEAAREHNQMYQSLNLDQLLAYEEIMKSVNKKEGKLFFVNGQGGTGKTFLWKTLLARVKANGEIALPTASSGIVQIYEK